MTDETIQTRRPTPAEVMGYVSQKEIRRLVRTTLPGVVQSYNPTTQTCVVQPVIRRRKSGDTYLEPAVEVPLLPLAGAGFVIHVPVEEGDTVWLAVGERSIDEWILADGVEEDVTAADPRRYDLQDAVALHGPQVFSQAIPEDMAASDSLDIGERDGTTRIRIEPSGAIKIRTSNAVVAIEEGGRVTITSDDIRLGSGGATDAVALAQTINAYFTALHSSLGGWSPVSGDGGAALKAAYVAALSTAGLPPSGPGSVSATKVGAE